MILRNAIITEMNLSKQPKKPAVGSIKFRFDMTTELASIMGWGCLYDTDGVITNGWDTLPLQGDLAVVKAKFKPNKMTGGLNQNAIGEITVTTAGSFAAHRVKGKGEDGTTFHLSGILRSADEQMEAIMGAYWRGLGEGGSQLTLTGAQANLFSAAEEKDED